MNTLRALLATVLGMAALVTLLHGQDASPPNVILILTDDQGYGDVGVYGNPVLETPTMDRLAAEGLQLTDFHVDPHCAPTRAALMTGRYSTRTGVWHTVGPRHLLARDEVTMAEVFAANGYRTGMVSKWHLGDVYPFRPQDRGFQEVLIHGGGGITQTPDYWGNDYFDDHYLDNGEWRPFEGYATDVFFTRALDFITANRERPFFLYIATNAPHRPWIVGEEYSRPYIEKGVEEELAAFYGMITNLDDNMDRLTRRLDELGLAENTILIFMGDNGTAGTGYNAGLRGRKASQYEGGHRVPFFVRYPAGGLTGGRSIDALTAHIDVLPTLAGLAGLDLPDGLALDGQDLTPLLRGEPWPERTLFVHSQRVPRPEKWQRNSVMTERWRLVNGAELYDIEADRGQRNDVAAEHPAVVDRLRREYEAWWMELEPAFDRDPRFVLGSDRANPTRLTAHDWYPREGERVPFNQVIASDSTYYPNGHWAVEVARPGTYEFTLRPRPYPVDYPLRRIASARLAVGGFDETRAVDPGATEVRFTMRLEPGETTVRTWLTEQDGSTRGAYFIYIERVGK